MKYYRVNKITIEGYLRNTWIIRASTARQAILKLVANPHHYEPLKIKSIVKSNDRDSRLAIIDENTFITADVAL